MKWRTATLLGKCLGLVMDVIVLIAACGIVFYTFSAEEKPAVQWEEKAKPVWEIEPTWRGVTPDLLPPKNYGGKVEDWEIPFVVLR